jgi:formamidase
VYLLLSCCPCEGRISGIVDVPNACATLAIPLSIFDRDVRPTDDTKLEALANGIRLLNKNVCMSEEGGAMPDDPRLG